MKNYNIKPKKRSFSFGEMSVITLGERGRGRFEAVIPCQSDIEPTDLIKIDTTKSGGVKIVKGGDTTDWLAAIYTEGCYTRNTLGTAYVANGYESNVRKLAEGHGAYGDAGRIGDYYDFLCIVKDNTFIRVRPSGGAHKYARYWLYFGEESVQRIEDEVIEVFCDAMGVDVPVVDDQSINIARLSI